MLLGFEERKSFENSQFAQTVVDVGLENRWVDGHTDHAVRPGRPSERHNSHTTTSI